MKNAVNGVHDWLTDLIAYVTKIANGDMTASMAKASDQDQIHEWLVLLKNNINALVADAASWPRLQPKEGWAPAPTPASTRATTARSSRASTRRWRSIVEPLKVTAQNARRWPPPPKN